MREVTSVSTTDTPEEVEAAKAHLSGKTPVVEEPVQPADEPIASVGEPAPETPQEPRGPLMPFRLPPNLVPNDIGRPEAPRMQPPFQESILLPR